MSFLPKLNRGSFCSSDSEDSSSYSSSSYSDSSSSSSDSEDEVYRHKSYLPKLKKSITHLFIELLLGQINNKYKLPKSLSNTNMRMIRNEAMNYSQNFYNPTPIRYRNSTDNLFTKKKYHKNSFSSSSSKSSASEESSERYDSDSDNKQTEAVVQMSNMSFKVIDSPDKTEVDIKYPDKSELHVTWNNVQIREYKTSISSTTVPTNDSAPIGLSWNIVKEEEYKLDEYEEYKENDPEHIDCKNYQKVFLL